MVLLKKHWEILNLDGEGGGRESEGNQQQLPPIIEERILRRKNFFFFFGKINKHQKQFLILKALVKGQ